LVKKLSKLTVSGSAANLLAFSTLTSWKLGEDRIKPGDEVITVAAGFPTTVSPIIQNGCIPVFVDIDVATHNVDVEAVKNAITEKTRAIMLAHSLGNPFDCNCDNENLQR
jgi:CDP-6-deoxy-D-xylo-4-hexulose-3-dehydrase